MNDHGRACVIVEQDGEAQIGVKRSNQLVKRHMMLGRDMIA